MKYFIRGLCFMLVPIIVRCVLAFLRQPKKAEKGKVYLPKFFLIFGVITSIIFLIPTIITAFSDEPVWLPILFLTFSLLGAILTIVYVNCRISYDEDGFVHKSFFGIKRNFTYDQVTAIKRDLHENYIYVGKHRVMIDEFAVGGDDFIGLVEKKYDALHDGKHIPTVKGRDIFNGNVKDATGFITVYVIGGIACIVFLLAFIHLIYTPSTINNTIEQQVIFESCVVDGNKIKLISSDNQLYEIHYADRLLCTDTIKSLCNGKTVVTTYSDHVTPRYKPDYYLIEALRYENDYLLSFDEMNKADRQGYGPFMLVPVLMIIMWGAFVAGSIIVGRNPNKYGKKVVKLFFKESHINVKL